MELAKNRSSVLFVNNINIITTLLIINSSVAEISCSDYIILH